MNQNPKKLDTKSLINQYSTEEFIEDLRNVLMNILPSHLV